MTDSNFCLGSVFFCSTNVVPCTTEILLDILSRSNRKGGFSNYYEYGECKANTSTFTLFPLEIRRSPEGDKYVVSNQPFASSPSSLNGTGYGTLNGKNLKEKAARSNWKSIRLPSLIDAAACMYQKIIHDAKEESQIMYNGK